MKNEWFVIEVTVKGQYVDLVTAVLADAGSQGTVIDERELDTFVVPDEELDQDANYNLKAYFPEEYDPQQLCCDLRQTFDRIPLLSALDLDVRQGAPVRMEDWAENWKQNFSAMQIGESLIIRPSWEAEEPAEGIAVVEIDPGMAFGTGTHGTTRLCLEVIERLLSGTNPPENMLDVGTGSGILALGAAALGCPRVLANDIDADVCEVARENIRKNGYEAWVEVTEERLEQLDGRFDLVVANILAEENVRLAAEFVKRLKPGGWLVLSGILKEKETYVRDGFEGFDLDFDFCDYADEWVVLAYRRTL